MIKFPLYVFLCILAFYLLAAMLISCGPRSESSSSTTVTDHDTSVTATAPSNANDAPAKPAAGQLAAGCYQMIIDKDTAWMNITPDGHSASGKLVYKRFEKDNNSGNFKGTITGDNLRGWYSFNSEGMLSVREVVFKIKNNALAEGYGDIAMRNDTAYFKYPQALQFEENHLYTEVNCK
jgi:hypothetical protein